MEEYILKLLKELKEEIRLADQRIKQLELKANKGAPNGYAELDANAKVPVARIPEIPLSNINIDVDKNWNAKNIINVNQLGIGTITPTYRLELSLDSAAKPATNTWTVISDKRIKKNIVPADLKRCYEIVKNLPLVYFSWDDGLYTDNQVQDRSQLGWLSQDVEQFFPKSITTANLDYAQKVQAEEEYEEQTYDEIEIIDEQGNVVKDEEGNILRHKVPRAIKKKRTVMRPVKSIPDCKGMNADQIIKALYGAVQYLIQKIESLEKKI